MCTAVIGGLVHRAASRISTPSSQRSATPRRNHRTKDRRKPFRSAVLGRLPGFSVTFQNNRPNWIGDAAASNIGAWRIGSRILHGAARASSPRLCIPTLADTIVPGHSPSRNKTRHELHNGMPHFTCRRAFAFAGNSCSGRLPRRR